MTSSTTKQALAAITDTGLSSRLERLGAAIAERDANKTPMLPLWPEAKRGTPNAFIRSALFSAVQGKDRIFIKDEVIASQDGVTIIFRGEQLNQDDLTLWDTLVHLCREQPLGDVCYFTAHGILKALGNHTGGAEHKRLHTSIMRLIACAVRIVEEPKPGMRKKRGYTGSLVMAAKDEEDYSEATPRTKYALLLDRTLLDLYGESGWTAVDWQQRTELRRKPLAQALHAYYSSHRYPYPVGIPFLQRITGSRNASARNFKQHLKAALADLQAVGFLSEFAIAKDGTVTVKRVPTPGWQKAIG